MNANHKQRLSMERELPEALDALPLAGLGNVLSVIESELPNMSTSFASPGWCMQSSGTDEGGDIASKSFTPMNKK